MAKEFGRLITVDTRMRDDYDLSSLADVIQVARDTGVRALVSHLVYQYGECVMEESLQMLLNQST